jgi:tRNA dimethylallyltransferase
MTSKRVIVIGGPTASGKTELGIAVALATGGEIVSADSMQIYKGMDIGTAKASEEEQMQVAHHMIDVADPRENYSVARYVEEASECCDKLLQEGKIPVIVGGTGLYIDSLLAGRSFGQQAADESLRKALNEEYETEGGEKLLEKLRSFDPERAALLHPADKKRIVRPMEVYYLSGETITEHDRKTREIPPRYEAAVFIPGFHDRALLYERIDRRVGEMIRSGLFEEVKTLLDSGIPAGATAMQAIGYKEAVDVVYGRISAEEAADRIRQASRRYAKRQITWFARRQDAVRLFHDSPGGTEKLTEEAVRLAKESIHDNC